jgi:trehalose utilization protein
MGRDIKLPNGEMVRANFGFAEGAEEIVVFWMRGGRYFGCRTNEINPYG